MSIVFKNECGACIDTPLCNKTTMYVDNCDGAVKVVDDNGCINTVSCGISVCDIPTDNCQLSNSCGYVKGFSPEICCISFSGMGDGCSCTWHVPSGLAVFEGSSGCAGSGTTYSWSFNLGYGNCAVRNGSTICLSQPTTGNITVNGSMFAVASGTIKIYVLV